MLFFFYHSVRQPGYSYRKIKLVHLPGFGVFVGSCNRVMEGIGKEVEVRDQNAGFIEGK